jgi:hypothetical protein
MAPILFLIVIVFLYRLPGCFFDSGGYFLFFVKVTFFIGTVEQIGKVLTFSLMVPLVEVTLQPLMMLWVEVILPLWLPMP